MSTEATSSSTAGAVVPPLAQRVPQKTLGQEDYFKLLAVQFSSQDPLKPMDDTSFIAEMANFSALENSAKLTAQFERFADQQVVNSAQALLGRTVTIGKGEGESISGVVSAVRNTADGPLINVDGEEYEISSVRQVELTPAG